MCLCRHSQEFASPHFNDEDIERNRIKKKTQRKRGILLSAGVSCVDMCAIPNVNNFYIDIIKFNRYLAFERRIHPYKTKQIVLCRDEKQKSASARSRDGECICQCINYLRTIFIVSSSTTAARSSQLEIKGKTKLLTSVHLFGADVDFQCQCFSYIWWWWWPRRDPLQGKLFKHIENSTNQMLLLWSKRYISCWQLMALVVMKAHTHTTCICVCVCVLHSSRVSSFISTFFADATEK